MSRVGVNPLKRDSDPLGWTPASVTITTVTYIPSLENYWQYSLDVLKVFFDSLYANTPAPFNVMLFDNGSCAEVRDYLLDLQQAGKIQYLTFSEHNLRKLGALAHLLSVAPGDYIAFADSDVYFLPGWLEQSIGILQAFPEAGRVTALPIAAGDQRKRLDYPLMVQDPSIRIETGHLIPDEYIRAHHESLGRADTERQFPDRLDVRIARGQTAAYLSGADFQFVITRQAVEKVLPLRLDEGVEVGGDTVYAPILEYKMKKEGLWRLSTVEYLVHHMGNRVPDFRAELGWVQTHRLDFTPTADASSDAEKPTFLKRLARSSRVRSFLRKLYTWTYKLLFEQ